MNAELLLVVSLAPPDDNFARIPLQNPCRSAVEWNNHAADFHCNWSLITRESSSGSISVTTCGPTGSGAGAAQPLNATILHNPFDQMRLSATYVRIVANVGAVSGPLTFNGSNATHRTYDLVNTEGWVTAGLVNGWVNYIGAPDNYARAAYRKTADGYVELRGAL